MVMRVQMSFLELSANNPRFEFVSRTYFLGATSVLLIYDLTDASSFTQLQALYETHRAEIPETALLFLIGTKLDLLERPVPEFDAKVATWASELGVAGRFQLSAKTGTNVEETLHEIARTSAAATPAVDPKMKLITLGPTGAGATSLVARFVQRALKSDHAPVGVESYVRVVEVPEPEPEPGPLSGEASREQEGISPDETGPAGISEGLGEAEDDEEAEEVGPSERSGPAGPPGPPGSSGPLDPPGPPVSSKRREGNAEHSRKAGAGDETSLTLASGASLAGPAGVATVETLPVTPPLQRFQKNVAVEYFDVMNPLRYYPLVVNVADVEQVAVGATENLLTGERRVQTKDKLDVELRSSVVTVVPIFPGCSVTPTDIKTDFRAGEDELTFYVTPLATGRLRECRVDFVSTEGDVAYSIPTPARVKDPQYAKSVALYGVLASIAPKLLAFLDVDLGNDVSMGEVLPGGLLGDMSVTSFVAILGILGVIVASFLVWRRRKPSSLRKSFSLRDIRHQ